MKHVLLTGLFGLLAFSASAQEFQISNDYRVCPADRTREGISVVQGTCGDLERPDFSTSNFASLDELQAGETERDTFQARVSAYSACVTDFITAYQKPGMPADSMAPDQAACAHSWAQDQATETVREFGRACINFSNRSMMDARIEPWDGACYPVLPDIQN